MVDRLELELAEQFRVTSEVVVETLKRYPQIVLAHYGLDAIVAHLDALEKSSITRLEHFKLQGYLPLFQVVRDVLKGQELNEIEARLNPLGNLAISKARGEVLTKPLRAMSEAMEAIAEAQDSSDVLIMLTAFQLILADIQRSRYQDAKEAVLTKYPN